MRLVFSLCLVFVLGLTLPLAGWGFEEPKDPPSEKAPLLPNLKVGSLIGKTFGAGPGDGKELTLSAEFKVAENGRDGVLSVTAVVAENWHIYSITQLPGGPIASKITVEKSPQFEVKGTFHADRSPKIKQLAIYKVSVEEHEDQVVWSAPIRVAEGVEPKELVISLRYDGQVCTDGIGDEGGACKPVENVSITAKYAGVALAPSQSEPAKSDDTFRLPGAKLTLRGLLDKATVAPGGKVKLLITATPDPEWYVYALEKSDPKLVSKPTLIVFTETAGLQIGEPLPLTEPKVKKTGIEKAPEARYYVDPATWTTEISIPEGAKTGEHELVGLIGFQTCKESSCLPPSAAEFRVKVTVGDARSAAALPLSFQEPEKKTGYSKVAELAGSSVSPKGVVPGKYLVKDDIRNRPLIWVLPIALLGGFILNFMPCVLPVIGLKILSFVQQAGESRARIFTLNLWYTFGMLSVFMVLATLAVVWNLGWGEQNNNDTFNIVMASVVFTMGLSFLGVWEIPIPGFVGGEKASQLTRKEGPAGAFFKGAITTVLATPCSGPGLASALWWCGDKPVYLVYLIFLFLGLGMALPYLVIGAIPSLVRFVPKPGAWMETFKQVMGFVLLGTVVFILTYLPAPLVIPTLALLFAAWFACWWIGRTPLTAEFPQLARAWIFALTFAGLVGVFSFTWFSGWMKTRFNSAVDFELSQRAVSPAPKEAVKHSEFELPWQAFSFERLHSLTDAKKTVLVDFTADWCLTCKTLEANVLNTKKVRQAVDQHGVETLVADWTTKDPQIGEMLSALGSKQIPVLAIFPAGRPNEPIVLIGGYTQATLIKRIEEAVGAEKKSSETTASRGKYDLPWQPYSPGRLESLKESNKTVLVNVTADWSTTDKYLETMVLNTKEVQAAVKRHKVESLTADFTAHDPKVVQFLDGLGEKSHPTLAIFPAGRPNEPIVLRGGYTKAMVVSSIEEASGPRKKYDLPWQPFSREKLESLKSKNKIVLVYFTADWDASLRVLQAYALDTKKVRDAVERHHIETLEADWTNRDEQIKQLLNELGSEQIPLLAIYPAGRPEKPIILTGGFTQSTVIELIEEAAAIGRKTTAMK